MGLKICFPVLERINNPPFTATDYTSTDNIHRLYLDHKFVNISRKASNSAFIIRSNGTKYSFSGGNKIWKRTRDFNFINGSNTQIDWNHSNIATGFTSYNIESIAPDNQYEINDKINFTYETLPIYNKKIESFHFRTQEMEDEWGYYNVDWTFFRIVYGGTFFNEFKSICMEHCMGGLTPQDPSFNLVYNNCLSTCNAIAADQDSKNKIDWNNTVSQSPEIMREERKLIKSIDSKEYQIDFFYTTVTNNNDNKVLNEIVVYQKSYQSKLLLYKYKFTYVNYSNEVNLLKDISKYSNDNILIDRYKFDYYNENLLSSTNVSTFPVNKHNNYVTAVTALESCQTAELKEVFLANGSSVKYTYIKEPEEEGVIVSNLNLNSGKNILNYQYTYNNSVPNFFIANQKLFYALASKIGCDPLSIPNHGTAVLSKVISSKEVARPYWPSYYKNIEIKFPDGSKRKKTFDLYASQITLIKDELFSADNDTVEKTKYNYEKQTSVKPYGDISENIFSYIGYKMFLAADLMLYYASGENNLIDEECSPGIYYKSFSDYPVFKNKDLYYLKSVNDKQYFNSDVIENNTTYEYDLANNNNIYPLKVENSDSKGKLYKTTFTYDTKWKPLEESKYIDNILYTKTEKKYNNLGQVVSEKTKSYHNNQETLLSNIDYQYNNGQLNYVKDNISGYEKYYRYGYGGFRPLYELEFPTGVKNADITIIPNFSSLQLEYDNPQSYFSSLIDAYGLHFKKGYIYNPHGIHKIYDVDKRSTTFLYDAAGRVVQKLDHDGNILESINYHSKILGDVPLSAHNETLFGNYNWQAYYEDCLDTEDNADYNLGCLSSNSTNVFNIKLHFNGNTYNLTSDGNEYILDTALNAGINIPVLNGAGIDGTNLSRLKYGKVDQADQSYLGDCRIANGYLLLESAYPLCDCEIFFIGVQN